VYIPVEYEKNFDKKYPILYLVLGWRENENGWSIQGHIENILDGLIDAGKAVPIFVLMLDVSRKFFMDRIVQIKEKNQAVKNLSLTACSLDENWYGIDN
jgi:enterochelin esterase-like enzyme